MTKKIVELPAATILASGDLLEGVDVSDLTDDPTGSSKKVTLQQIADLGPLVQRVYTEYTTYGSSSTVIPADDTIPQNTEGVEIMQVSITPRNAGNILRIRSGFLGAGNVQGVANAMALFQDTTVNALRSAAFWTPNADFIGHMALVLEMTAGTTSPTIFKIRVGPSAGGVLYINGNSGGRVYGGSLAATLIVDEYAV